MTERVAGWLYRPVDAASAVAFRALFGLVMFGALLRLLASGWLAPNFVEPAFVFRYPGFAWVPRLTEPYASALVVALCVLALCIAVGLFYRWACALFAVGFAWLELIDVTNYLNHYYLVVVLAVVLAFLPLGRVASIDAWRKGARRPLVVPAWAVYLLRFQVGVVYLFAGLAKLGTDWLLAAQPMGIWMSARTELPVIGPWLGHPLVPYALSWAGFLYDATIVGWLSWSRSRPWAYAVLCVFHFFTSVFFDIGIFPVLMTTSALIFFSPSWPRALVRPLRAFTSRRHAEERVESSPEVRAAWTTPRRVGVSLAVAWCLVHLIVPLRHYAYPGDVIWNEEGMRWSWKVMLREKQGSVTYRVRDPASGREWMVSPSGTLNARQAKEMGGQPDLIVQFAQHVAAQARARGIAQPEVRVDALVSLNGRAPARLIDPEVNLLEVDTGLARAEWILPAPEEPAPTPFDMRPRAALAATGSKEQP